MVGKNHIAAMVNLNLQRVLGFHGQSSILGVTSNC